MADKSKVADTAVCLLAIDINMKLVNRKKIFLNGILANYGIQI